MSKISTWSTTAASNNSTAPDDWPEGMPETVNSTPNDCFLERFINDIVEDKDALNDATVPWVSKPYQFSDKNDSHIVEVG